MAKFRKKPVEIEAIQYVGGNAKELYDFVDVVQGIADEPVSMFCVDFEAAGWEAYVENSGIVAIVWDKLHTTWVGVKLGDWIIKGVQGEFYPCDDAVFQATYERVD